MGRKNEQRTFQAGRVGKDHLEHFHLSVALHDHSSDDDSHIVLGAGHRADLEAALENVVSTGRKDDGANRWECPQMHS